MKDTPKDASSVIHANAQLASLIVDPNPGSQMQFWWKGGDGSHWPHDIGPIMTYTAQCVGTTCDQYKSTNAKWFKIEETGLQPSNLIWSDYPWRKTDGLRYAHGAIETNDLAQYMRTWKTRWSR